jgi:hypothetical protein
VIVGSQIKKKKILSLVKILTNFRRCRLQIYNLDKLIFVNKNWPNDPKIRCKFPFNLLEFLERDIDLEEELEKFGRILKGMKLLKCKSSINKLMVIKKKNP